MANYNPDILIESVNVDLLREQRDGLLLIHLDATSKENKDTLDGVINLLDHMIDLADDDGIPRG